MAFQSTKIIELGSCAFRQPAADSHCRFLHGYRLTAKFWFGANELDKNNWVVDFGSLSHLKKILKKEHEIYPKAIALFAKKKILIRGRKVRIKN